MSKVLDKRTWESVNNANDKGALGTTIPITIDIATVDTYEKIIGTYIDSSAVCSGFTVTTDGKLTLTAESGDFELSGVSTLEVDSACTTSHAIFVNGVLYTTPDGKTFETPNTFTQQAKLTTIAVRGILHLIQGDYIEIFAKSSALNNVTINNLSTTLKRW